MLFLDLTIIIIPIMIGYILIRLLNGSLFKFKLIFMGIFSPFAIPFKRRYPVAKDCGFFK